MKKLIEEYGVSSFETEIRKTFQTKDEAINWEERVLCKLKVRKNASWVNITNSKSWMSMEGDANPSKRQDVKNKISQANKGRKRPDQSERMKTNHPLKNEETRAKMIATRKSKIASGEITIWSTGKKRPEISGERHHRFGKKCESLSSMNSVEYKCPICAKIGKGPGMKRYHFDNCKLKISSP